MGDMAKKYPFGKTMRRLMSEHGVQQSDIVHATGIEKSTLSRILKGETRSPSIHTCKKFADYFGMNLVQFWDELEKDED